MTAARQAMMNQYNTKLHYHDEYNENAHEMRNTNTFKSNIAFSDPASGMNSNKGA